MRPVVLCVLDGVGRRAEREGNAVRLAATPHLDALGSEPHALISTSGPDVGLSEGQAADGEVGYVGLGAGRVVPPQRARVDDAIAGRTLRANPVVDRVFHIAKHHHEARIHFFGLLDGSGARSSWTRLHALIEAAHHDEIPVVVHAFLDAGETASGASGKTLALLERLLEDGDKGIIGTLSGRSYAMDRGPGWDRVHLAYKAIVRGEAPRVDKPFDAVARAVGAGKPGDLVEPVRVGAYTGIKGSFMCDFAARDRAWRWFGEENGLAVDVRPDRMHKLASMLTRRGLPPEAEELLTDRGKPVFAFDKHSYATMTTSAAALMAQAAFPWEAAGDTFGEVVSQAGLTQLRCADTARFPHVTWFFNGGREEPFQGEERRLTPSSEVAREVVEAIRGAKHDFILASFADCDVAGHGGELEAAIAAVERVDAALGAVRDAVREAGGVLVVTAVHGNCEQMLDAKGRPHRGHTASPTALHVWSPEGAPRPALREDGRLADVAPTLLELLGLAQPEAMTGRSLLVRGP